MKYLKRYNESIDDNMDDNIETFYDCFNDISDDGFDVDYKYKHPSVFNGTIRPGLISITIKKDGFNIREISSKLLMPFSFGREFGIRIDLIEARDMDDIGYDVEEDYSLNSVILQRETIKEFLERYFDQFDAFLQELVLHFVVVDPRKLNTKSI